MQRSAFLLFFIGLVAGGLITAEENTEKSREQMLSFFAGEWVSRALYAVTKLEIADHLQNGPKSIDELAILSSSHPEMLKRILNLLECFGFFKEVTPGNFENTDMTKLLMKNHPDSLHHLSLFFGEEVHKAWEELVPCIQTGVPAFQISFKQPVFSYFKDHPERANLFHTAMKEKSQAVIKTAITAFDFERFNSLCDLGGGYAHFALAVKEKNPRLAVTLFELPEVIAKMKPGFPLELVSGNFFETIPKDKDAYLLKSVLHDFDDEDSCKILMNCHTAMHSESKLLVIESVLQSPYAHCMDIQMMVMTGGRERNVADFQALFDKTGFVLEKIYPTSTEFSILELKKE